MIQAPRTASANWGASFKYVIESSSPKMIAVYSDDFSGKWDKDYYWDVQLFAPIKRVLDTVWPKEDWSQYASIQPKKREQKKQQLTLL